MNFNIQRKTETNHSHPTHPTNHSSDNEYAIRIQALKGRNTLAMGVAHRFGSVSPFYELPEPKP